MDGWGHVWWYFGPPSLNKPLKVGHFSVFQHLKHKTWKPKEWLCLNHLNVLEWRRGSPDLYPTNNLWWEPSNVPDTWEIWRQSGLDQNLWCGVSKSGQEIQETSHLHNSKQKFLYQVTSIFLLDQKLILCNKTNYVKMNTLCIFFRFHVTQLRCMKIRPLYSTSLASLALSIQRSRFLPFFSTKQFELWYCEHLFLGLATDSYQALI